VSGFDYIIVGALCRSALGARQPMHFRPAAMGGRGEASVYVARAHIGGLARP